MLGSLAGVGVFVFEVRDVCFPRPMTDSYQSELAENHHWLDCGKST